MSDGLEPQSRLSRLVRPAVASRRATRAEAVAPPAELAHQVSGTLSGSRPLSLRR